MSQNKNKKLYLQPNNDNDSILEIDEFEESDEGGTSSDWFFIPGFDFYFLSYEEDIECMEAVKARRKKLPKSVVDDQFFNLTEMEAFLDAQDKAEEEKQTNSGRNLGDFDIAKKMDEIIQSYEEENLRPRNWVLQGEVVAEERKTDELLEHSIDVDYQLNAPTINEETTQRLETIIRKRCKEKFFDDVIRKFRENEAALIPTIFRNQTEIEQNVRRSLAEVYADKFVNSQNDQQEKIISELDPQTDAIQKDMNALFLNLDALSHFQFRPQKIQTDETKIINNMPSLCLEEVGPTATTEPDVNLLAPEEIVRRTKAVLKSNTERTETDKKRERRNKKKRQAVIAAINTMNEKRKNNEETNDIKFKKRRFEKNLNFVAGMDSLIENNKMQRVKK